VRSPIRFAALEDGYVLGDERGGSNMDREEYVVWITTRTIKPGSYEDFRRAWQPKDFPQGMLRAYECDAAETNEVIGIALWNSLESCDEYRLSNVETGSHGALRRVGDLRDLHRPRAPNPEGLAASWSDSSPA
jgi:hypothetical protein